MMSDKPTYQGLEKELSKLKMKIETLKSTEKSHISSVDFFKAMLTNISDVISIFDQDGNIKYSSPNITNLFGWQPQELVNKDGWFLIHPDDLRRVQDVYLMLTKNENAVKREEFRYKCKNGSYIHVQITGINLLKDPIINGILVNYHDISERKRVEEDLKKSKDRVRRFTENSQDMIYRMSLLDGKYEYVSPAAAAIYGYEPEEWYNNPLLIEKIIPHNWKTYFKNEHAKLMAGNLSPTFEHPIIHKSGKIKWIHQRNVLISDEQGNAITIEGIVTDITERKKNEQKIQKQNEELKELNATKDKFFSIIAHDLKSPFQAMLGFSELLVKKFDKYNLSNQKKFITIINEGLQKTFNLLENLLIWSRSQSGLINFKPEKVNLYLLSNETTELLYQSAENKKIKLINEIPKEINVNADKDILSTIIRNLTSNAIKFTAKGGVIKIMTLLKTDKNNPNYIEISVKDNGIGISTEIQSKLFSIGENKSTQGTENETGTGLGLILCKELVERHSGKIWVESKEGKGSEFKFSIPLNY